MVAQYMVSDVSGEHVVFRDAARRSHLAHALNFAGAIGAELHGPHPQLGFAVLSPAMSTLTCRVIFIDLNCNVESAEYAPQ